MDLISRMAYPKRFRENGKICEIAKFNLAKINPIKLIINTIIFIYHYNIKKIQKHKFCSTMFRRFLSSVCFDQIRSLRGLIFLNVISFWANLRPDKNTFSFQDVIFWRMLHYTTKKIAICMKGCMSHPLMNQRMTFLLSPRMFSSVWKAIREKFLTGENYSRFFVAPGYLCLVKEYVVFGRILESGFDLVGFVPIFLNQAQHFFIMTGVVPSIDLILKALYDCLTASESYKRSDHDG